MFMQFHVFIGIIRETETNWKFVASIEYHSRCLVLNIAYVLTYYTHSQDFWDLKFPTKTRKHPQSTNKSNK